LSSDWETEQIISKELYTDLGLSIQCVFVTTSILIGHIGMSLIVLAIIIVCLLNIMGFMHFWGCTIEPVSVMNLTIAAGFVVDYR